MKYPTNWSFGIPRGSIVDRGTNIMLSVKSTKYNKNKYYNSYPISDYTSKNVCLQVVKRDLIKYSHEFGLTRNEIRFLDADTIEVQLTQDKTFITDSKHINIINKYPLQAKCKREKNISRYYVVAQDKKNI